MARIELHASGTPLQATDFTTFGWGAGNIVSNVFANDSYGTFRVTAGTTPTENPYIVLTFKDGTWGSPPFSWAKLIVPLGGVMNPVKESATATQLTITFVAIPDPLTDYDFKFFCIGS